MIPYFVLVLLQLVIIIDMMYYTLSYYCINVLIVRGNGKRDARGCPVLGDRGKKVKRPSAAAELRVQQCSKVRRTYEYSYYCSRVRYGVSAAESWRICGVLRSQNRYDPKMLRAARTLAYCELCQYLHYCCCISCLCVHGS